MVSRRNYAAITIIMAIVFFLFQLLNMAKASWNNYQTKAFVQDTEALPDCSSVYQAGQQMSGENDENWMDGVYCAPVVCIGGNENGSFGELLRDWGFYMKRSVSVYKSVSDYQTVYENENEIDNLKNTETAKD